MKIKRYKQFNEDAVATASTAGAGDVSNSQPGDLPGTTGVPGSGDRSSYLTNKKGEKVKKGKPSEVSDMRFLEPVKTEKIEDIKESINEFMKHSRKMIIIIENYGFKHKGLYYLEDTKYKAYEKNNLEVF